MIGERSEQLIQVQLLRSLKGCDSMDSIEAEIQTGQAGAELIRQSWHLNRMSKMLLDEVRGIATT